MMHRLPHRLRIHVSYTLQDRTGMQKILSIAPFQIFLKQLRVTSPTTAHRLTISIEILSLSLI